MTQQTDRLNTALDGRYRIIRHLGEGGMATVYLCEDLKHDRQVALKLLKPELAAVLGAERFVQEIKTTAALQHPHILPLFDSGAADGFLFYVMPFIDGETLRSKLNRETQLSVDDAVRIAREVLDALDYAHTRGIVHRDVKPENILLHGGHAMVADFGIALAVSAAAGGRMTETGLSLGTPHYMSPEQATAEKEITPRSDVYSLGSVLYEMLTGNAPFTGANAQQIIMKIITEPAESVTKYRKAVPPNVVAAVAKSLEKLPADRFETAKAFAEALSNPAFAGTRTATGAIHTGRDDVRWRHIAIATGIAAAALLATTIAAWWRPAPHERAERYEFPIAVTDRVLTTGGGPARFAISRDGTRIVYSSRAASGVDQLFVRDLGSLVPRIIPGTDGAFHPAFSPDGESVAFIVAGALKTISVRGENATTLVASNAAAPAWADDDMIYFTESYNSPGALLRRISAGRGHIDTLVSMSGQHFQSVMPVKGGQGVLATLGAGGTVAVALPGGAMRPLVNSASVALDNDGHIVYVAADGMIMAAGFDPNKLALTGPAVELSEKGAASSGIGWLSVSPSGALLYGTSAGREAELAWVSRDGVAQGVDTATRGEIDYPALSPDGTRIAFAWGKSVWIRDLVKGTNFRLTNDVGEEASYPAWTSDGRTVSYYIRDSTSYSLHTKRADGGSPAVPLLSKLPNLVESLWSPDGTSLVVRTGAASAGAGDIYVVRASADTTATPILNSKFTEAEPALSPDGKWLAFISDETGRYEVSVVQFPDVGQGGRWNISTRGGTEPVWSHSGKELFYRDGKGNIVSVEVKTSPTFSFGASKVLFSATPYATYDGRTQFAVSRDDQRFLMVRLLRGGPPSKLILVKNWLAEFKARDTAK